VSDELFVLNETRDGSLMIWEHPRKDVEYVVGIDPAENRKRDRSAVERRTRLSYSDQRPDYSAAVVLEVPTALHVATWHGYCPPGEFATICAAIGYYYGTAMLVPETNSAGIALLAALTDSLRYPNIYRARYFNALNRDPLAPNLGFRTDKITRAYLMSLITAIMDSNTLFTRDKGLISEIRTMEFDDQGNERARGKNKDDQVFALALALEGRSQMLVDKPHTAKLPTLTDEQAYARRVWQHVQQETEKQDDRRRDRGGLFAGPGFPVWTGRGAP